VIFVAKDDFIEATGTIIENLPASKFLVKLDLNDVVIEGFLSGKMRQNKIRVLTGDKVKLEMSPYDLTKGRIVFRIK
jgi:translation initiation factor IF-1